MDEKSLIGRLVLARRNLGITQAEAGVRIARPQARIAELERGRDVRLSSLIAYANALGYDLIPVPFRRVAEVDALLSPEGERQRAAPRSEAGNFDDLFIPDPEPDEMDPDTGRRTLEG